MDVTLSLPGRRESFTWKLNQDNALLQRSEKATIMVFQALSEFQIHLPQMNEIDMDVTLSLPGRKESFTWKLNQDNALLQRSEKAAMKDKIVVTAKGRGQGTLTVMSLYYTPQAEGVVPCKNFDFNVTLEDVPKKGEKINSASCVC
ncbi:complement C3 alpha chain-like, partial [Pyxicephalus adspersus]|uniref:complement C3 alpha chain-like n=1 Tax=Pyxicephalus adspersus TaxID=30357 RepID=UPI003B5B0889